MASCGGGMCMLVKNFTSKILPLAHIFAREILAAARSDLIQGFLI